MQRFIRKGLTVGLLAVAVVAGIGRPAAAITREPGEDPGDGPIERPTPTPTPRIESFEVSTDSVVATATLSYNGDPSAATVLWGDGTSTSRCPAGQEGPVNSGCVPNPFGTGGPAGTLVLTHRYTAPADGAPFTVTITAKLGRESQTVATGVTPRYKVTVSDMHFSPLAHCDTDAEEDTEWRVSRTAFQNGTVIVPRREWNFDHYRTNPRVVNGDFDLPQFEELPGSDFSVELTASDHPTLGLFAVELDLVLDDYMQQQYVDLNPLDGSRFVDLVTLDAWNPDEYLFGCRAEYLFDLNVRLLEPGLSGGGGGPVLSQ
jgi:hypothetical protein